MDERRESIEYLSHSSEETLRHGEAFGSLLCENQVVAFFGDLGSGKTTFIKGIAKQICKVPLHSVVSPTFTYLHVYTGQVDIFHFDLYRIPSREAFIGLGFHEYLGKDGICLIEWAEHISSLLPENTIHVNIETLSETSRKISVVL
ncbi:MAG: tRNA (adenosine(37)-N6)-threonylcarbamoyltransferase complex ATPase subunit type 1 TsaE [Chlamydiota bacterium]